MSDSLSRYIGLIVGTSTGRCYAVVNPEHDDELGNPRHLLLQNENKEPVRMARVERGAYMACMTPDDVDTLIAAWHDEEARRIMREPPYDGPDYIDGIV